MKILVLAAAMIMVLSSVAFAAEKPQKQVDYKNAARQAGLRGKKLREAAPETMQAFGGLAGAVLKEGALSLKTKELIALMLGLQAHCEMCINSHVQNAIKAGVTREELAEALGVAVLMGGGPSSAYAGIVLEAYDQFSAK
ncbi:MULTISPECIES: carboxymuconolactone decarboxylase family protein [unclassified Pyramidobacter]|uniref:carboxymuconolactone decarboxylase family protein n=1 Tax=unclassified Pyramidobacter TaxID=2632171 RepID=UPI001F0A13C2|nr:MULTISPECIES: carboxymuconolactone decarboxylase family protein [unclassified Pyramidobacter]MCI7404040.1 carboxymuconolactone decarboxylase family protein [Pyramidobacter sp.]MDY3213320.1 carboxymuconolactone decarboxylase family protein [Pyramidobacter sp.]WOL40172.1 carboxymuconolactone decarboxylase family protein [Pyramidobacter sp. YE332]